MFFKFKTYLPKSFEQDVQEGLSKRDRKTVTIDNYEGMIQGDGYASNRLIVQSNLGVTSTQADAYFQKCLFQVVGTMQVEYQRQLAKLLKRHKDSSPPPITARQE